MGYEFERVEVTVSDSKNLDSRRLSSEQKDKEYETRIKVDSEGNPIIIAESPLKVYGLTIEQYNQTGNDYDPETEKLIDQRRDSYQRIETARASMQQEREELNNQVELGKKTVAEAQALQNETKTTALVDAQQEVDIALVNQAEAVTMAEQLEVEAEQEMLNTKQLLAIAKVDLQAATFQAKEQISQAEALRAQLEKGGALSAKAELEAEMRKSYNTALATELAKVPAPSTVIVTSGGNGGQGGTGGITETLLNLFLLKSTIPQVPGTPSETPAPQNN